MWCSACSSLIWREFNGICVLLVGAKIILDLFGTNDITPAACVRQSHWIVARDRQKNPETENSRHGQLRHDTKLAMRPAPSDVKRSTGTEESGTVSPGFEPVPRV
jgi:hypothetical protein